MPYAILNGQKVYKVVDEQVPGSIGCPDNITEGWILQAGAWIPPEGSIEHIKLRKKQDLNNTRATKLDSPAIYNGYSFDTDSRSLLNIIAVVSAGNANIPLPQGFTWRTADNQDIPMTRPQLVELAATLLNHVNTVYATSWQKKALVDAATTIEEVNNITW